MKTQYKPIPYFSATFIVTFLCWSIGGYYSFQQDNGRYMIFMLVGLMTPFLVAVTMIYPSGATALRKEFFSKLFSLKRINLRMLPALLLLMPVSVVVSVLLSTLFGGSLEQFTVAEAFSFSTGFVPVLLLLFLAALFEELGWRGYAFESLEQRYTYFTASLIFSILWSAWHLPLLWVNNSYQYEILHENIWYAVNFYWSIIPMGFIISWFCLKNRKSILSAILFHFIINLSQEALEITQATKSIQSFVLLIFAAVIVYSDRELFFKRPEERHA